MLSHIFLLYVLGDLKEFYQIPVGNKTPLDIMRNIELPKNLHINYEYIRFHPGKLFCYGTERD